MGRDLLPCLAAAVQWGNAWCAAGNRSKLVHRPCGRELQDAIVCSACHGPVDARQVRFRTPIRRRSRGRKKFGKSRYVGLDLLERGRPCPIARTMAAIGDPWSFLILRECFYGIRRFDDFHKRLSIATNILTTRLKHLLDEGILTTRPIAGRTHQYRLTEKGMALYCLPLTVIAWGDRWLAGPEGPPLVLTHKLCGQDFSAVLRCAHCDEPVDLNTVTYRNAA
jgi:DNA-binding HxlR family transcriptional regulator